MELDEEGKFYFQSREYKTEVNQAKKKRKAFVREATKDIWKFMAEALIVMAMGFILVHIVTAGRSINFSPTAIIVLFILAEIIISFVGILNLMPKRTEALKAFAAQYQSEAKILKRHKEV